METIFPNELKSGSVKSQEDLDAAFAKYPNLSKTYVQTAVYWREYREWYEKHWPLVYKYLDKNFLKQFKSESEHTARAWEFHLAAVLTEKEIKLEEKTWQYGPDFCIKLQDGRNLWIEATVCDRGTVDPVEPYPNMVSGVMYSRTTSIEEENRPRALRITSAIGTKFEKFKKYIESSEKTGVKKEDYLLIAVSGVPIQHFAIDDLLFKRAVFAHGLYTYVKVPVKEKMQGPFYKPAPTITKNADGKELVIPANFMEMAEFSKISAVLYCGYSASHSWNNGYQVGDDFLFAYHTNPDNPIPENLFNFGRGISKNVMQGTIIETNQGKELK